MCNNQPQCTHTPPCLQLHITGNVKIPGFVSSSCPMAPGVRHTQRCQGLSGTTGRARKKEGEGRDKKRASAVTKEERAGRGGTREYHGLTYEASTLGQEHKAGQARHCCRHRRKSVCIYPRGHCLHVSNPETDVRQEQALFYLFPLDNFAVTHPFSWNVCFENRVHWR